MIVDLLSIAILCATVATPAGPLDGYLANYQEVSVKIEYETKGGQADHGVVERGDPAILDGSDFLSNVTFDRRGTWSSDGKVQRYQFKSETLLKQTVKGPNGQVLSSETFPTLELLVDGEKEAHHIVGSGALRLEKTKDHPMVYAAVSPFHLWMGEFPYCIDYSYPNVLPVRSNVVRNGRSLVLEAYYKVDEYGKHFAEIYYDPNLDCLVRYGRSVLWDVKQDKAIVNEHFLTTFRQCAKGGLVPTGWVKTRFKISSFGKSYPSYAPETKFHDVGTVGFVQFRTLDFRDLDHPVALTSSVKDLRSIHAMGGVALIKPRRESLTLDEIVKIAGRYYAHPAPPLPLANIDREALHEFDRPQARAPWKSWLLVGAGGVLLSASLVVWRRRRATSMLLILPILAAPQSGCGLSSKPFDSLAAEFSPSKLIFRTGGSAVPVTLVLKNAGNRPLRVMSIDAGCSCRQIDKTKLPATIAPGAALDLPVHIQGPKNFQTNAVRFDVVTDRGPRVVLPALTAMPDHVIEPSTIVNNDLGEKDDWSFTFTHREINQSEKNPVAWTIHSNSRLRVEALRGHSGPVVGFPGYWYHDTDYRAQLNDRDLGTASEMISLTRNGSSLPLASVRVVWKRSRFLSTTPERVVLGSRPVRVFLRCPDDSVELTRVLAAPRGVKAAASSPREILVKLDDQPPSIIDGLVEIETTAKGQPPLQFRVVRFAMSPASPTSDRSAAPR